MEWVEEYDGAPLQIIARCRNCGADLSYFNAMNKFEKHLWSEEFCLVRGVWKNENLLCHTCAIPVLSQSDVKMRVAW